jgi:polyisoprenyl-phosphate glycosyltransferase
VIAAILGGASVEGWPTLMATVLFLGGVQLLVTGMLGEYIWRALDEARARPLYVLAETVGIDPDRRGTDSST